MIGAAIRRIFGVFFGFAAAVLAAILTLFFVGGRWATGEIRAELDKNPEFHDMPGFYDFTEILGTIAFTVQIAPALTLLPALAVVILGEVMKIRSVLYYVAMGGLAAALMPLVLQHTGDPAAFKPSAQYLTIMATAGFAAGFVYWLIAGRNA